MLFLGPAPIAAGAAAAVNATRSRSAVTRTRLSASGAAQARAVPSAGASHNEMFPSPMKPSLRPRFTSFALPRRPKAYKAHSHVAAAAAAASAVGGSRTSEQLSQA